MVASSKWVKLNINDWLKFSRYPDGSFFRFPGKKYNKYEVKRNQMKRLVIKDLTQ